MGIIDQLPEIKAVITWGVKEIPDEISRDSRVYKFSQFLEIGSKIKDSVIDKIIDDQKPGKCCCLIYTSGTTGNPKGVMLSHDNLIFSGRALNEDIEQNAPEDYKGDFKSEDMSRVSYLPLSHIAGLMFDLINTMLYGARVYFARPDAL